MTLYYDLMNDPDNPVVLYTHPREGGMNTCKNKQMSWHFPRWLLRYGGAGIPLPAPRCQDCQTMLLRWIRPTDAPSMPDEQADGPSPLPT